MELPVHQAACLKFEKHVLMRKYMSTDVLNLSLNKEKNKHNCSTGEALRILFDAYVSDLVECSFALHPTMDQEDGDQINEHRNQ